MAAKNRLLRVCHCQPDSSSAWTTTALQPTLQPSQKILPGRSPAITVAARAVSKGSMPAATAALDAVSSVNATADSSGKPSATPRAATPKLAQVARAGSAGLAANSTSAPTMPATITRPLPNCSAVKSVVNARVIGKVPAKLAMPKKAAPQMLTGSDIFLVHITYTTSLIHLYKCLAPRLRARQYWVQKQK